MAISDLDVAAPHIQDRVPNGEKPLRVLFISSQWPTPERPEIAPFVPREVNSLRAVGVDVDVLPYRGGFSPGNYLRAVREMRRMIREKEYDLIHVYFGQCGIVGRLQTRLPVVITYGGSDVEGTPLFGGINQWKNVLVVGISRTMSLLVDEVIVVSDNLGRKLPRRDYNIVTIVLELDKFKPGDQTAAREQLGLPLDKKLVLFSASSIHNTRKRHWLAKAAVEIAQQSVDCELVTATGLPPEMIPVYMQACDVFILTSTNEGSPNVVREALACNLPVVSTDVGDVRERLDHIEGCEVTDDDQPETIAAALVRSLQHPANNPRNLSLREEVLDQNPQVLGNKVVEIYRKALRKHT